MAGLFIKFRNIIFIDDILINQTLFYKNHILSLHWSPEHQNIKPLILRNEQLRQETVNLKKNIYFLYF